MIFTNLRIEIIIVIIALIASIIFFKNKKNVLIVITIVAVLLILIESISRMGDNISYNFSQINISQEGTTNGLSIVKESGKNILYDNVKNQPVSYKSYYEDTKVKNFYPVYLRDIGDYYIVVFSSDNNKDYSNGRFLQDDYEFYDIVDQIYFIRKANGSMLRFREYDIIGKTIDLNKIYAVNHSFIYHVLIDFESDISYVGILLTNNNPDPTKLRSMEDIITELHYHGDDYSYIKKFVISDDYLCLWTNSLGNVYSTTLNFYFTESSSGYQGGPRNEILANEEYVKEGYFTTFNGDIYYVGNDLKIYQFGSVSKYIADVADLNNWESQLSK